MTTTQNEFWASVPSVEDAMESVGRTGFQPSDVRAAAAIAPRRRTVLKSVGALGGALALNVFGALKPSSKASATRGTEYLNCAGYDGWPGYNDDSAICVGFQYSRDYCGGDGWFLQYSGTCFASGAVKKCGSPVNNAWRWTFRGTPYRCADGFQQWCGGSGYFICSWSNP